ncbi:Membrane transporter of cations and cationic drugs [Thermoplasmatales archaeon BRNA1]|nr:Membrane transporter of cations and cationic drugs [Thermoplasmatales archaeon BRNA1]
MDKSENFKYKGWGIAAVVLVLLCLYLLAVAVAVIGPGVSYAILAGIGAIGIVVIGRVLYREKLTPRRMMFVGMIVAGIIGVRLVSGGVF